MNDSGDHSPKNGIRPREAIKAELSGICNSGDTLEAKWGRGRVIKYRRGGKGGEERE